VTPVAALRILLASACGTPIRVSTMGSANVHRTLTENETGACR